MTKLFKITWAPVEVKGRLMNNGEVNEWKIGEDDKEGVRGDFFGGVSNCLAF